MANKETDRLTSYPTTFLESAGTQTKLALRIARRYGCVPEGTLPMNGKLSSLSTAAFYTRAAKYRIASYHNLRRNRAAWRRWLSNQASPTRLPRLCRRRRHRGVRGGTVAVTAAGRTLRCAPNAFAGTASAPRMLAGSSLSGGDPAGHALSSNIEAWPPGIAMTLLRRESTQGLGLQETQEAQSNAASGVTNLRLQGQELPVTSIQVDRMIHPVAVVIPLLLGPVSDGWLWPAAASPAGRLAPGCPQSRTSGSSSAGRSAGTSQ